MDYISSFIQKHYLYLLLHDLNNLHSSVQLTELSSHSGDFKEIIIFPCEYSSTSDGHQWPCACSWWFSIVFNGKLLAAYASSHYFTVGNKPTGLHYNKPAAFWLFLLTPRTIFKLLLLRLFFYPFHYFSVFPLLPLCRSRWYINVFMSYSLLFLHHPIFHSFFLTFSISRLSGQIAPTGDVLCL